MAGIVTYKRIYLKYSFEESDLPYRIIAMKILLTLLTSLLLLSAPATAATVNLKDGRVVNGTIVEQTNKSITVDANGVTMTYYADEVQDVDGTPLTQPAEAVPAAEAAPSPASTNAVSSAEKRDLILKFIDVFGTREAMTQNLDAMLKTLPADSAETQKLQSSIKVDEIIDRLIPVYDKEFSAEDLKAYIDFYSSSQGRKLVSGIRNIMQQSIEVSAQYFQEKFPELSQPDNK